MVGLWMFFAVFVVVWKLPEVQRAIDRFSTSTSSQNEMIQELYDLTGQHVSRFALSKQLKKRKKEDAPQKPPSQSQRKPASSASPKGLSVIEGQINLGDNEGARLLELFRAVWEHREQRICDSVHCPGRVTERRGAEYLIPARCDDVAEAVNNLLKPDLIWENYCGQEFTAPPPSDAITMQSERHNLATGYSVITYSCYGRLKRSKIQFVRGRAPWMLPVGIQQLGSVRRSFSDLPEEITIPGNHRYERVAITMHNSDHYTAILRYKAGYRLCTTA